VEVFHASKSCTRRRLFVLTQSGIDTTISVSILPSSLWATTRTSAQVPTRSWDKLGRVGHFLSFGVSRSL
jgi:hypothetical protein